MILRQFSWLILAVALDCAVTDSLLFAQEEDLSDPVPSSEEESPATSFGEDEEALPSAFYEKPMREERLSPESDDPDPLGSPSEIQAEQQPLPATPSRATVTSFPPNGASGAMPSSSSPDAWGEFSWPSEPLPEPPPLPPFMTRPLEWEDTPPAVIGMPTLPSASAFVERDRAAFQFIEDGKENFDREDWALAREQFERAVSLAPLLPYSYYFLGRIAFARGELTQAVAFLQKAELLFPRSDVNWLCEIVTVKGAVYEDLQDYPKARVAYHRSLQFQPTNLKVLSALARLPEQELPSTDAVSQ